MDDPRFKFFEDSFGCSVCFHAPLPSERVVLRCGHSGCRSCVTRGDNCPECRAALGPAAVAFVKDYKYQYAYDSLCVNCPDGCDERVFPSSLAAHAHACVVALQKRNCALEKRIRELEAASNVVVVEDNEDTDGTDLPDPAPFLRGLPSTLAVTRLVSNGAQDRLMRGRHLIRDSDGSGEDNNEDNNEYINENPVGPPRRRRRLNQQGQRRPSSQAVE